MKQFWDERYAAELYAYGETPNLFFKEQLDRIAHLGRLLMPAEGEGRNAVYAATRGWEVTCFDISVSGKKKAEALAKKHQVEIDYRVGTLEEVDLEGLHFECIGLVFAHFPPALRTYYHKAFASMLSPRGMLILEGFSKSHLAYNAKDPQAGGPKKLEMLFSAEELMEDFSSLKILRLTEEEVLLNEGPYHVGSSAVIRMLAQQKD